MTDLSGADSIPGDRRSLLLGAKLKGLVGAHLASPVETEPANYPSGAALVLGTDGWVLVDGPAGRQLGRALAWALRAGVERLHLIAENSTGVLARRAGQISFPVEIWFADGRTLLPAVVEPLPGTPRADAAHLEMASLIEAGGAEVNVEHGVVFGEVRGLEVCRVVDEPTTGHIAELNDAVDPALLTPPDPDDVILEVGVGANDREAFRLIHGDVPAAEALATVVDSVRTYRSADAPQHPLNRMAPERYLRWRLEEEPGLLGFMSVRPAEPPLPRPSLRESVPCVAEGVDSSGAVVRIVCSTGVDPDLVGFVADLQIVTDDEVLVVLRERDRLPITDDLLALLRRPVTIRTLD